MRIDDLRCTTTGDLSRAAATITWEDCDRPQRDIYFETDAAFADELTCNPDAFLLAAFTPAMRHGERRVRVKGKACPQLRNGLITAMQILRRWYGEARHRPVDIEATEGFAPPVPRAPARTASFLSGGVDALATVRSNRLDFPLGHPSSIADGFFVHGLDVGGYERLQNNRDNSKLAIAALTGFAQQAHLTLIPVRTNVRHLDDDDTFHYREFYGAILSAIAHSFSRRLTTAMIAAGSSILDLNPIGSHPLLDPNYSSASLAIEHDGIRYLRMEKVGLISQWDAALRTLRSCFDPFRSAQAINCGQCEKCLRTMTELLVHGKLRECPTYPLDDISPGHLQTIIADPTEVLKLAGADPASLPREQEILIACRCLGPANVYYWRELMAPLAQIGRHDLTEVIEAKLAEHERFLARLRRPHERLQARERTRQRLKRFDQQYLGGRLITLKRRLTGRGKDG